MSFDVQAFEELKSQMGELFGLLKGYQDDLIKIRKEFQPLLKEWDDSGMSRFASEAPKDEKGAALYGSIADMAKSLQSTQANINTVNEVIKELELKGQRAAEAAPVKTSAIDYGETFVESPEFKLWLDTDRKKLPQRCEVKLPGLFQKEALVDTDEAGGENVKYSDQVDLPYRVPVHRDLLRVLPLDGAETIKFDQQSRKVVCTAVLTAQTASGSAVYAVDSVAGFSADDGFSDVTIRYATGTQSTTIASIDASGLEITMDDDATATVALGSTIEAENWIATPEAELKPQHLVSWEEQESSTKKIAETIKITYEVLRSRRRIADSINRQLLEKLSQVEEFHVLWGPGTAEITGLMVDSNIPTVTQTSLLSKYDMLLYAMTVCEIANYVPTVCMMTPQDYRNMVLLKDDTGRYIIDGVMLGGGPTSLWGLRIIKTTAMRSGYALVGDFSMGATLFVGEDATVQVGWADDDFIKNKRTLLAETFINMTIDRPDAFCKIAFS